MTRLVLTTLVIFTALSLCSQAQTRSVEGRWESTGKRRDSSIVSRFAGVIRQQVVFNSDRTFRRDIYFKDTPKSRIDTVTLRGNYKADFKKARVFFRVDLDEAEQTQKPVTPESYTTRLQFLSDTSIYILNNVFYKKKKVENNPLARDLEQGSATFYLQNLKKTGRTVRIRKDHVVLMVNESKKKGEHLSRFNTSTCVLAGLKRDSVIVRLVNEEIDSEYRDHFSTNSNSYFQDIMSRKYRTIALTDISYINMKSPARKGLSTFGRLLMGLSILTILASPLAAISVPEAEKSETREAVFFMGLSGLVVAAPFFVFGKSKKYGISKNYKTRSKNYWQIKVR